jgi:CHAT domain-containing protein/DnaJ-like protein
MPLAGEWADMERLSTYQDFDLLIEPGLSQGGYRARVLRSPAGESTPVHFTLPFSAVELENFVLKIGQGRRRTRGPGRPESAPLKEFGGKLYSAVFQDELRDTLQSSLSQTRAQRVGLRLRLRLADTPELADVPWEFLYDRRHNRFLAQSRRTPLVRYLDLPDPPHPLTVEGPLRLLVMISSASGYPVLDVEQEWAALTGALAQQQAEGRVIVERLAANMSELRSRLRSQAFHVFHFIGHGFYHPEWHDGVLVMENRYGGPHEVTGEDLGGLLSEYDQTRLAVLNACEGARTGASDPFAGMAQSLIQQGLPAVVAMQFEITDDAAIIFARELYAAIADGYPLEAALAEARGAIRDEGNLTEWGTPVLYSRAPDGHLFEMTKRNRLQEADRQAKEEADRQAKEEADRQAKEEADRQAKEEADRQARPPKFRDLLDGIFGTARRPKRGADVETEATVSPTEARDGATLRLRSTGESQCETCRGTGAKQGKMPRICPTCGGTGQAGAGDVVRPCRTCQGRGLVVDDPCPGCAGSGHVTMTRTINVRVPAGIKDGQRVRIKGQGGAGLNRGANGDLYLRVHVKP